MATFKRCDVCRKEMLGSWADFGTPQAAWQTLEMPDDSTTATVKGTRKVKMAVRIMVDQVDGSPCNSNNVCPRCAEAVCKKIAEGAHGFAKSHMPTYGPELEADA